MEANENPDWQTLLKLMENLPEQSDGPIPITASEYRLLKQMAQPWHPTDVLLGLPFVVSEHLPDLEE